MFRNFPEFESRSEVQVQNRLIPARLGQRLSLYWVIVFNAAASQKIVGWCSHASVAERPIVLLTTKAEGSKSENFPNN